MSYRVRVRVRVTVLALEVPLWLGLGSSLGLAQVLGLKAFQVLFAPRALGLRVRALGLSPDTEVQA